MKFVPRREVDEADERRPAGGDPEGPPRRARPGPEAEAEDEDEGGHEHEPVEAEEDDELPAGEAPGQLGGEHREDGAGAGPEVDELGRRAAAARGSVTTARTIAASHSSSGSTVFQPSQPSRAATASSKATRTTIPAASAQRTSGRESGAAHATSRDEGAARRAPRGEGAQVRGAERDEGRRVAQNRNRTPTEGRNGIAAVGSRTSRGWSSAEPGRTRGAGRPARRCSPVRGVDHVEVEEPAPRVSARLPREAQVEAEEGGQARGVEVRDAAARASRRRSVPRRRARARAGRRLVSSAETRSPRTGVRGKPENARTVAPSSHFGEIRHEPTRLAACRRSYSNGRRAPVLLALRPAPRVGRPAGQPRAGRRPLLHEDVEAPGAPRGPVHGEARDDAGPWGRSRRARPGSRSGATRASRSSSVSRRPTTRSSRPFQ